MHVPSKLLTTTTTTFLSFEPKCFKTTNPVTASALHHNSTAYVIESDDDAMVWSYYSQVSNVNSGCVCISIYFITECLYADAVAGIL